MASQTRENGLFVTINPAVQPRRAAAAERATPFRLLGEQAVPRPTLEYYSRQTCQGCRQVSSGVRRGAKNVLAQSAFVYQWVNRSERALNFELCSELFDTLSAQLGVPPMPPLERALSGKQLRATLQRDGCCLCGIACSKVLCANQVRLAICNACDVSEVRSFVKRVLACTKATHALDVLYGEAVRCLLGVRPADSWTAFAMLWADALVQSCPRDSAWRQPLINLALFAKTHNYHLFAVGLLLGFPLKTLKPLEKKFGLTLIYEQVCNANNYLPGPPPRRGARTS